MIKYKIKKIEVTENPIIIIGMCPGKQRSNFKTGVVFEGNRTGDLVLKIIEGRKNIILTNIFNYEKEYKCKEIIRDGLLDIVYLIREHYPKKVIILGQFAKDHAMYIMKYYKIHHVFLKHPSYIIRFNKDLKKYITKFKKELT